MDVYGDIKQTLQKMCQPTGGLLHVAKVVSVEGNTLTALIDGTLKVTGVRLRAVEDNDTTGILVTPATGSYVIIADISDGNKTDFAVVMFSAIDNITINGGNLGGLINIQTLTNKLNELVDAFNSHTHSIEGTAGTYTVQGTALTPADTANTFNKSDYEDTKIKH